MEILGKVIPAAVRNTFARKGRSIGLSETTMTDFSRVGNEKPTKQMTDEKPVTA